MCRHPLGGQYFSIDHPGKAWVVGQAPENQQVTVNGNPAGRQGEWFSQELTAANSTAPVSRPVTVNETPEKTGNLQLPKKITAHTHDSAGNLANDGKWLYEWDSANRLRKMTPTPQALAAGFPNRTLEFVYDWQGRRIAKKVTEDGTVSQTRYLYEAWNVVAEFRFTGTSNPSPLPQPQTYLWGSDLAGQASGVVEEMQRAGGVGGLLACDVVKNEASLGKVFPSYDGNGNILSYSGPDGLRKQTQDYDAFGNVVLKQTFAGILAPNQGHVEYGFSTKPEDQGTGMLYYGYRDYDPVTGRWPSRDPMGENVHETIELDHYFEGFSYRQKVKSDHVYYGYRYDDHGTASWFSAGETSPNSRALKPSRESPRNTTSTRSPGANLYGYVVNDGVNSFDVLGLDRWVSSMAGHTRLTVENCDSATGYTMIHFGPKNPWGLIGGDGLVIIEDAEKPWFLPMKIVSSKAQDEKLLKFAELMQQNPPRYYVNWFNCRHFTSIMKDVGIKDNPIQWCDLIPFVSCPFSH